MPAMRKWILFFAFLGLILGTAIGLFFFRDRLPFLDFGDPVFTEEIPSARPKRLDRREIARFQGQSMEQILGTLASERSTKGDGESDTPSPSKAEKLLASLPDAPLPFPEGSFPKDEKWLRDFIKSMKKDDLGEPSAEELWQFNLALAALNITPDQLPEALRQNTAPKPESDTLSVYFAPQPGELMGAFAVGDFDSEPDPEIIDQGGGRMSKLAGEGGPIPIDSHTLVHTGNGLYPADFDSDGDLDLYVTRGDGLPDSLLQNDGKGKFSDVTIEQGMLAFRDTLTAAWIDHDADGRPDLLVGSSDHPLELYHQTEGGTFQPVAWDLKLWIPRGVEQIEVSDVSGDGAPDFFLGVSDFGNRLYVNRPAENWIDQRFDDVLAEAGLGDATHGSAQPFDCNNDGQIDLLIRDDSGKISLHVNEGELSFIDVTGDIGLAEIDSVISVGTVDMDNDGYEDLVLGTGPLEINRVFWNRGGLAFREVSVASRLSYLDEPVQFAGSDLDRNGAAELIYRNRSGKIRLFEAAGDIRSWVRIDLSEYVPGTRVSIIVRDSDWVLHSIERVVDSAANFTIGLGEADLIESIKVFYPGNREPVNSLEKVKPNQRIEIELPKRPKKRETEPIS